MYVLDDEFRVIEKYLEEHPEITINNVEKYAATSPHLAAVLHEILAARQRLHHQPTSIVAIRRKTSGGKLS